MIKQSEQTASEPRKKAPRRLWSLPAARVAAEAPDELYAISRTVTQLCWLLLAAVLTYLVFVRQTLGYESISRILAFALAYAALHVTLQGFVGARERMPWPVLLRIWSMIALVAWMLDNVAEHAPSLAALYYLPVIASAVALNKRLTLLNLAIVAFCVLALAPEPRQPSSGPRGIEVEQGVQLAILALVAYVATRAAGEIRQALERIRFISETDELTRLYNIRAFMQVAERLHRQAKRYSRPYSLVMIDSDNLKTVNDTHGHECGNELLKVTTACIRRELRDADVAGRYGGDEFILLLPETGLSGARELSERIRRAVAEKRLQVGGDPVGTTVSIGVASFPDHGSDLRTVLNKADQAMYLSKRTGRDRVTLFDPG